MDVFLQAIESRSLENAQNFSSSYSSPITNNYHSHENIRSNITNNHNSNIPNNHNELSTPLNTQSSHAGTISPLLSPKNSDCREFPFPQSPTSTSSSQSSADLSQPLLQFEQRPPQWCIVD